MTKAQWISFRAVLDLLDGQRRAMLFICTISSINYKPALLAHLIFCTSTSMWSVFNHDTSYPLHMGMEFVESCKLTTAIHSCADDFKVVLERFLDLLQHSECLLSQHQILSVKMLDRQLLCRTQMKFQTTPDPAIVDHLPKRWLVLVKSLCHVQIIYTDQ